ncbi:MAG: methyltransferase domain-containing protein [Acidobacteriia bacterium]|nr:methyltransferase domain-containing protein [Terriglobia bacterium]
MKRWMKRDFALAVAVLVANLAPAQKATSFHEFLLRLLDIKAGMTVADVGAGRGELAFLLVHEVGPEGEVYANEISREKINQIEKGKRERSLANLTTILGEVEDPRLPEKVDYLVMVKVFHHLSKPDQFMKNAMKYLKPEGRLVITAVLNKRNPQAQPRTFTLNDPCVSDPEVTRKAIEKSGLLFEKIALYNDPNPRASWPTSYALVFRLPQAAPSNHQSSGSDPALGSARASQIATTLNTAEGVVAQLYRLVSFRAGKEVDWELVKDLFIPEAVIVLRASRTATSVFNRAGFVADFAAFIKSAKLEEQAFEERILASRTQVMGDVARSLVLYAADIPADSRPPQQGLDSFLLMKKDGQWRIVSIVNELVGPGVPVPEELRKHDTVSTQVRAAAR